MNGDQMMDWMMDYKNKSLQWLGEKFHDEFMESLQDKTVREADEILRDKPAVRLAFSYWTDNLCKNDMITMEQYENATYDN